MGSNSCSSWGRSDKKIAMGKSSIHIQGVKPTSERHNNREQNLNYVRHDLSYLNSSFKVQSIKDVVEFAEKNCKEKTGRKMQEIAKPVREGVLLISENHTVDDLKRLGEKIENRFGIKTIQGYCHKDEGHYDKNTNDWKPNYHAHMVFDWTNHKTGKSIKLDKKDLSELQTIVANELKLERGKTSDLGHLSAIEYKNKMELERLIKAEKQLIDVENKVKEFTKINIDDIEKLEVKSIIGVNTDWKFSLNENNEIIGLLHPDSTIRINNLAVESMFIERENLREEKGLDRGLNQKGLEL